jgi:hypothetical protein
MRMIFENSPAAVGNYTNLHAKETLYVNFELFDVLNLSVELKVIMYKYQHFLYMIASSCITALHDVIDKCPNKYMAYSYAPTKAAAGGNVSADA